MYTDTSQRIPAYRQVLVPCIALMLMFAAQDSALKAQSEVSPSLETVNQGVGWYMASVEGDKESGRPATELIFVTQEGLAEAPVSDEQRGILESELSPSTARGEDAPDFEDAPAFTVLDLKLLDALEDGEVPEEYEQFYEFGEGCGSQDKEKHKHYTGNKSGSRSWPLGGGVTGSYTASLPVALDADLYFRYRILKKLCIPYGVSFKSVRVVGTGDLDGQAALSLGLSYQHEFKRSWTLLEDLKLGRITFSVGAIPVWVDFLFSLDVGVSANVEVDADLSLTTDINTSATFDYTCTRNGCQGGNNLEAGGVDLFDLTAGVELEAEASAWVKPRIGADVWRNPWLTILRGDAGVKALVEADIWAYYGNGCGDADNDGHNETVRALAADVNYGYDLTFDWTILGQDHSTDNKGKRWPLGWWDLLKELGLGSSTALQPMLIGPAQIEAGGEGAFTVKMRPCYPYKEAVTFSIAPGGWNGLTSIPKPQSTDPTKNSSQVSRAFIQPGDRTLVATALSDERGRQLNAPFSRPLRVVEPQVPQQTLLFSPVADSFIQELEPDANFGTATHLGLSGTNSEVGERIPVMKFNVSEVQGSVVSAVLRVRTWASPLVNLAVYNVCDQAWSEMSITWTNAPWSSACGILQVQNNVPGASWITYDVTAAVNTDGYYTFALVTGEAGTGRAVFSRESAYPPVLEVVVQP